MSASQDDEQDGSGDEYDEEQDHDAQDLEEEDYLAQYEDNVSQDWSGSMTASVQSASSLLKKGVRSMVEKATGGNPGQDD